MTTFTRKIGKMHCEACETPICKILSCAQKRFMFQQLFRCFLILFTIFTASALPLFYRYTIAANPQDSVPASLGSPERGDPADTPLTTSFTFTGNVDVVVSVIPLTRTFVTTSSGTHAISLPPGSTVLKALLYTQDWNFAGGTAAATFRGTDLGTAAPFATDLDGGLHLATYRWDATSLVTESGSFPFSIFFSGPFIFNTAQVLYMNTLVVVFQHPSNPLQKITINDGGESLGIKSPGLSTTNFSNISPGAGQLLLVTEADDAALEPGFAAKTERVDFNGMTIAGPGAIFEANQGPFASLVSLPVTTIAGQNTAGIFADGDWLGWHLAILKSPSEQMIRPTIGGSVTQLFSTSTGHLGIDIDRTAEGTDIRVAATSGTIVQIARNDNDCGDWIWISHGDVLDRNGVVQPNISTVYLHMTSTPAELTVGRTISAGERLGLVGRTGLVTGPHLHFGVRQGIIPADRACKNRVGDTTIAVDPLKFVEYPIRPDAMSVTVFSPVDLSLTDPDGLIVNKQVNQLPDAARYIEVKHLSTIDRSRPSDEEGFSEYDTIQIDSRKTGDYLIKIIPESGATTTDTFSLALSIATTTVIVVKDIKIADISEQPYALRSTATSVEEVVPAQVRIEPRTLNLSSRGVFTALIQIPRGFGATVQDINPNTLTIAEASATRTTINKRTNTLIAKFNRQDLVNVPVGRQVNLTFQGKLFDGTSIEGADTIRVIRTTFLPGLSLILANLYEILTQLLQVLQNPQTS